MDSILNEIYNRRSIRSFENKKLSSEQLKLIMEAALRAPSARDTHSTQFVVVEDKEVLAKLGCMRGDGSKFLSQVPLAIAVLGSPLETERWIEDASLSAGWMQLQAENLGLSSCWSQVYGLYTGAGQDCGEYVRMVLDIPYQLEVLCILGIGYGKQYDREIRKDEDLNWEKIHIGKFRHDG